MEMISATLQLIGLLNVIGVLLLAFRPDRKIVLNDLKNMFINRRFALLFSSLMLAFFVLIPFSIPFSVIQIMKRGDERDY